MKRRDGMLLPAISTTYYIQYLPSYPRAPVHDAIPKETKIKKKQTRGIAFNIFKFTFIFIYVSLSLFYVFLFLLLFFVCKILDTWETTAHKLNVINLNEGKIGAPSSHRTSIRKLRRKLKSTLLDWPKICSLRLTVYRYRYILYMYI